VGAWTDVVDRVLRGDIAAPPLDVRLAAVTSYSWPNHARTILDAYEALPPPR
jgi:hypothetical protein